MNNRRNIGADNNTTGGVANDVSEQIRGTDFDLILANQKIFDACGGCVLAWLGITSGSTIQLLMKPTNNCMAILSKAFLRKFDVQDDPNAISVPIRMRGSDTIVQVFSFLFLS